MLTAAAARGGELLAIQAAIAATLVFAADADSVSAALARAGDAMIGGACAGIVSLFVLPPDPATLLAARFDPLLDELAAVLDELATALSERDPARAAAALERARATDDLVGALHAARPVALEIARLVPVRRGARGHVSRLASGSVHLDHAIRNLRALVRAALGLLAADDPVREESAGAADDLARAVRRLNGAWSHGSDGGPAAELARQAADRLATCHERTPSVPLGPWPQPHAGSQTTSR